MGCKKKNDVHSLTASTLLLHPRTRSFFARQATLLEPRALYFMYYHRVIFRRRPVCFALKKSWTITRNENIHFEVRFYLLYPLEDNISGGRAACLVYIVVVFLASFFSLGVCVVACW